MYIRLVSSDRTVEVIRPAARLMIHAQNLQHLIANAIGNDDGRVRNHQLARSGYPTRAAIFGIVGETEFDRGDNRKRDAVCNLRIVLCDIGTEFGKIEDCLRLPIDSHSTVGSGFS